MIEIQNKLNPEQFAELFTMLENTTFTTYSKNNRRNFPKHKALMLGLCRHRITKVVGVSHLSIKYPDLTKYIFSLFDKIFDFKYTSIQINKNVVCPPHIDSNNQKKSLIFSIGNYEGCNLFVEGEEYNTKCQPYIFDGSKLLHWNSPLISGTKYSFVLFNVIN